MTLFRRHKKKPEDTSPRQMYAELRTQVLRLTPTELGDDAHDAPLLALVMETGYPEGVATLVCVVDGSTSLYFSNGGGVIGAGEHADVALAGRRMLDRGAEMLATFGATDDEPHPPNDGLTQFLAVTSTGLRSAVAAEEDLGENRHELSPLFHAGHEVIAQIRLETD